MSHPDWKPVSYFITGDTISINFIGAPPYSMRRPSGNQKRSDRFDELKARIRLAIKEGTQEEWEEIKSLFNQSTNISEVLESITKRVYGSKEITKVGDDYYYREYKLSSFLVQRIEALTEEAEDNNVEAEVMLRPLTNFLENLLQNPSSNSVSQLFNFVQHTRMPITEDGCLIAYKVIRSNYTDKHTGTMDNSIGATVKEDRGYVDDNPNRTCSRGLHFCSWNYATGFFFSGDDRFVAVKINPKDVVSVPADYNNEKGRCCEYKVMWELDRDSVLKNDVLGMVS